MKRRIVAMLLATTMVMSQSAWAAEGEFLLSDVSDSEIVLDEDYEFSDTVEGTMESSTEVDSMDASGLFDNDSFIIDDEPATDSAEVFDRDYAAETETETEIVASGNCGKAYPYGDNVKYTISKDGTLTISGTGQMSDRGGELQDTRWRSVKKVVILPGVTNVGSFFFYKSSSIKTVILPDTIMEIKSGAFGECTSLEEIKIPEGVSSIGSSAFDGCKNLTTACIPSSVSNIGWSAFQDCTSLSDLVISDGVTNIDNRAFSGCTALSEITIPKSVVFSADVFAKCTGLNKVVLEDGLKRLGGGTFEECTGLKEIAIPDSVTEMGYSVFKNCKSLSQITLSKNLKSIPYQTFSGCSQLQYITLPEGLQSIGERAFENAWLKEINIPETVTEIGRNAFWRTSITHISIPEGVKYIKDNTFWGCIRLTSITMPDSVTEIWKYAFEGCDSLTEITLSNNLEKIGENAFSGCGSLKSLTIPDSVRTVESGAFSHCFLREIKLSKNMTRLEDSLFSGSGSNYVDFTIPDNITSIGNNVFSYSYYRNIVIPDSVTSIGKDVFAGCKYLKTVSSPCNLDNLDSLGVSEGQLQLRHNEVKVEGKDATCEEAGSTEGTHCTICDKDVVECTTIPPLGHTVVVDKPGVEATCAKEGLTEESHCSVCGKVLSVQTTIPKLVHSTDPEEAKKETTWGTWEIVEKPCKHREGNKVRTCTVCGEIQEQSIDLLQDNPDEYWTEWETIKQPCVHEVGTEVRSCIECGEREYRDLEKLSEGEFTDWSEWLVVQDSTYTEEGKEERTCNECGFKEERIIPKKQYSDKDTTEGNDEFQPSIVASEIQNHANSEFNNEKALKLAREITSKSGKTTSASYISVNNSGTVLHFATIYDFDSVIGSLKVAFDIDTVAESSSDISVVFTTSRGNEYERTMPFDYKTLNSIDVVAFPEEGFSAITPAVDYRADIDSIAAEKFLTKGIPTWVSTAFNEYENILKLHNLGLHDAGFANLPAVSKGNTSESGTGTKTEDTEILDADLSGETSFMGYWNANSDSVPVKRRISLEEPGILSINIGELITSSYISSQTALNSVEISILDENGNQVWYSRGSHTQVKDDGPNTYSVCLPAGSYTFSIVCGRPLAYSGTLATFVKFGFTPDAYIELEGNETTDTATRMEFGKTYKGFIISDGAFDEDYFKFSADKGRQYRITIDKTELKNHVGSIYVYDPDLEKVLYTNGVRTTVNNEESVEFKSQKSGYYYICFHNFTIGEIPYQLMVEDITPADEEPNLVEDFDVTTEANLNGSTKYHPVWDKESSSSYNKKELVLDKPGDLKLTLEGTKVQGTSYKQFLLSIENEEGKIVWSTDGYQSQYGHDEPYIYHIGLDKGKYVFSIRPKRSLFSGESISVYYGFAFTSSNLVEKAPNGTFADATAIDLESIYTGFLDDEANGADYFSFDAVEGRQYKVARDMSQATGSLINFKVLDPDALKVTLNPFSARIDLNNMEYQVFIAQKTGKHYVQISGYKDVPCSYQLKVTDVTDLSEAEGHVHEWAEDYTVDVPATCDTDGSESKHCILCDAAGRSHKIYKRSHIYGEWLTVVPATVTSYGTEKKTCTLCGHEETRRISKLPYVAPKPTVSVAPKPAPVVQRPAAAKPVVKAPVVVSPLQVRINKSVFAFNGKSARPKVTAVTLRGTKLSKKFYKVSYSGDKKVGTAQVIVQTKGKYSGYRAVVNYTITTPQAKISKAKAKKGGSITLSWKKIKGVSGYEVQIAQNAGFAGAPNRSASGSSMNFTGLTAKTNYYMRVRAFAYVNGSKQYGAWSKAKKCKAK